MKIVTNADDFGYDADTVTATIECFNSGALTSASIMPKMPATDQAIEFALSNPQHSFGVHLTFVCDTVEAPISPPEHVRGLVRDDGRFLPSQTVRKMALLGKISVDQIAIEAAAQIDFLISRGVKISHVDSHGHLHKFAPFRRALARILPPRSITRVRNIQDIYFRRPLMSPTYWLGSWWRRRLMRSFKTTEHFYMCASAWDEDWPSTLLAKLSDGTLEVGVHPGKAESWRLDEYRATQEFAKLARERGHELVGWASI